MARRVLEKWTLADWKLLLEVYGKEEVGDAVKQLPGLEKKALSDACAVLNLYQLSKLTGRICGRFCRHAALSIHLDARITMDLRLA
jgi:hypothetical protein